MENLLLNGGGFQYLLFSRSYLSTSPFLPIPIPNSTSTSNKARCQTTTAETAINELEPKTLNVSSLSSQTSVPKKTATPYYSSRRAAVVDVQRSPNLESALARYGTVLKVQDLNIILRYFGKLNRWKDVSELFHWMKKHGKINVASYSSFFKFMGKSRNPIKALETYTSIQDESSRNNVSVCNSILGCLIRNGKFESSVKLFDQMKLSGLVPNAVTYSTLLSGCMKGKQGYTKALQLVQEMKYNGLQMDTVIYGSLLAICASNNLLEDAEVFFKQMKDEGYSPNEFHYSSLLNAYSVEGNYSKADDLVKDMKAAGLVPNKVFLTTLLKAYVRGGLFEKARELLVELEGLGYAEEEMPYCLLMDGLAKAGNIDEAKSVFDEMEKKVIKSDGYAHSIMISAFCRSGQLEEAKQLARDFEAKYDNYDLVMLNTMLRAYCKAGEMESVMQMMRKMDELTISPDSNTFHILIKYFCKEKLYQLAYRTTVDMHSKGYPPSEELGSSLILNLGIVGSSAEAFSVYNMLRYSKRTLCRVLHGKILNILVAGGLHKDAYVVVKDNAEQIPRASLKKFALSFMKSGNINLVNDVLKVLHSSGFKIDQENPSPKTVQTSEFFTCKKYRGTQSEVLMPGFLIPTRMFIMSALNSAYLAVEQLKYIYPEIQQFMQEVFTMGISRYIGEPEKKELLLQLLQWMTGQGYVVDASSRNLILKNSHLFGRHLIGEILAKQHKMSKVLSTRETSGK